jgi:cytochrome c553
MLAVLDSRSGVYVSGFISGAVALFIASTAVAQSAPAAGGVTYTKDIAPVLQRSCENCHRADGVAPMSLTTYEEVRPWARAIKQRTGIGPHAGVMPPWYAEKNIGIQNFKNDPSLSDEEVAKIAKWADGGAPRGNPADMPPARKWEDANTWTIGAPDLMYVITNSPYGLQVTRGAVYSDYEFTQDIGNRLTDDAWRQQVAGGTTPARPDWIGLYFSK